MKKLFMICFILAGFLLTHAGVDAQEKTEKKKDKKEATADKKSDKKSDKKMSGDKKDAMKASDKKDAMKSSDKKDDMKKPAAMDKSIPSLMRLILCHYEFILISLFIQ